MEAREKSKCGYSSIQENFQLSKIVSEYDQEQV